MPRHHTYGQREDSPILFTDRVFVGVNQRLDPAIIPQGYVADSFNCRFNHGVAETRKGHTYPIWANRRNEPVNPVIEQRAIFTSYIIDTAILADSIGGLTVAQHGFVLGQTVSLNFLGRPQMNHTNLISEIGAVTVGFANKFPSPPAIGIYADTITAVGLGGGPAPTLASGGIGTRSWGTIYGTGIFKDPTTFQELLVIATAAGVYYTSPNNIPYVIALPAGVTLDGPVTFTQAFDRFIMHRGKTKTALQLLDINSGWTEVIQTASGTGTKTIPSGDRSLFFQNRLFIPFGNDEIAASDFNDYTRYLPTLQEFRINQGSADKLVTITKFNDITLIAFKERSVYAINNVYRDLAATQLDQLSDKFGLVAPKAVAQVGSDLWFLSQLGVMSIRQTEQNKLQGVVLPVSEPIQPLIDRINWRFASGSVAAYWQNQFFLSVPLDAAELIGPELSPTGLGLVTARYRIPTTFGHKYRLVIGTGETSVLVGATVASFSVAANVVTATTDNVHTLATGDAFTFAGLEAATFDGTHTVTGTPTTTSFTFAQVIANGAYAIRGTASRTAPATKQIQVLTGGTDFVAEGNFISVAYGSAAVAGTSLREVVSGVNTGILIYDFLNGAWSGLDVIDGVSVTDFIIMTVRGEQRLLAICSDGFVRLLNDTFEDQLAVPYTDLTYTAAAFGDPLETLQVNGGTVVTMNGASDQNGASTLGTQNNALIAGNLFTSAAGQYGYYAQATIGGWTTPNAVARRITGGVRFYGTNGLAPSILTDPIVGTSFKITVNGTTQITSRVRTRSYTNDDIDMHNPAWIGLDLETWNPKYSLTLVYPGTAEEFVQYTGRTKDRAKWYRPFDKTDFDLINAGGLAGDKYRQDYSLLLSSGTGTGTAGEAVSFAFYKTTGGVQLGLHQAVRDTIKTTRSDSGVQVQIDNTQGRFRLSGVKVESRKDQTKAVTIA